MPMGLCDSAWEFGRYLMRNCMGRVRSSIGAAIKSGGAGKGLARLRTAIASSSKAAEPELLVT